MFGLPDSCALHQVIDVKKLPLYEMDVKDRRKFRDSVVQMELAYVVRDSVLPAFVNETYRILGIQVFSITIDSLSHVPFAAEILQKSIKTLAVLYFTDGKSECYSFALKRLNKNDANQVVVTHSFVSQTKPCSVGSQAEDELVRYAGFDSAVNRSSLFSWYLELMVKCFILKNRQVWSGMDLLLSGKVWYDSLRVLELFEVLQRLVRVHDERLRAITMSDSLELNSELKRIYGVLDEYV